MQHLIVVDVGSTLGRFSGEGRAVSTILGSLAPASFPRDLVNRTICRVLHRTPELTEDVIHEVCDDLHIDRRSWPESWPSINFEPFAHTAASLARLNQFGSVVALSNVPVTSAPAIRMLADTCGTYLNEIYTSYGLGSCKPARWLWRYIADLHGVTPQQIIHIGDRWAEDILGPLSVGARAVWIKSPNVVRPTRGIAPDRGWTVVDELPAAVTAVESLIRA